jgi:hypothetical protein
MAQSLIDAMATTVVAKGGFYGKYRMKPRGRWFVVADTKNVPILFLSVEDALSSAQDVGRMYRTGATA